EAAVAGEVGLPGVVQGEGFQALALALAGDVDEGAIERVAGQCQERHEADAGRPQLPRLQRARAPAEQGVALGGHPGPDSVPAARNREAVTAATHRFDRLERAFGIELLAQAADEYLEHVGVAVEILLV